MLYYFNNIPLFHKPLKRIYYKYFGICSIKDKGLKDYIKKAKKELNTHALERAPRTMKIR